jgi:transposase-like protein
MTKVLNVKKKMAIDLRKQGKSYGEIMNQLDILSKGTLSFWFRDIELGIKARNRLRRLTSQSKEKNLTEFNKRRTAAIIRENNIIYKDAEQEIGRLSKRDLLMIGTSLYWGGGCK